MQETPWYDLVSMPALLRHARRTYGEAMRRALEDAGYEDIPANGLYVIGGLALEDRDLPLSQLIKELGITKQGAGQLIDTMVSRGYLSRAVNDNDRRQIIVALTDRGRAAASVQDEARKRVDQELLARVGKQDAVATRRTLGALIEMQRNAAD